MNDDRRNLTAWLIFTFVMLLCLLATAFDLLTSSRVTLLDVTVLAAGLVAPGGLTLATRRMT